MGVHECRLLWPNTPIQCLVSLGTGHYDPQDIEYEPEYSSLKKKLYKIMQSATETECKFIEMVEYPMIFFIYGLYVLCVGHSLKVPFEKT